jgi:hypothetical protein
MNALLKRAVAAAEKLPDEAQESIAGLILDEIEAERGWQERFAATQDQLGKLVQQARVDVAETGPLPFDPSNRPAE